MHLSVVIAADDEMAYVEPLARRLAHSLSTIPRCAWEIVFVVEGWDGTREGPWSTSLSYLTLLGGALRSRDGRCSP